MRVRQSKKMRPAECRLVRLRVVLYGPEWPPDSAHGSLAAVDSRMKMFAPRSGRRKTGARLSRPLRSEDLLARNPTATLQRCRGLNLVAAPGHTELTWLSPAYFF